MEWYEALLLGLIQGLTEFLPVSSSGHITIGGHFFGLVGEENLMFAVAVHAATVLSTIVVFRKEIGELFLGLFKFQWNEQTQYITKIAISMIPVGIVGVFFKDYVESLFGSGLMLVGAMLLLTATLLIVSARFKPRQKETISFKDAFIIGVSQAIAIVPGLSRSGTTIAMGLMLGNKRESVAKFSFLMVIVPILGEAFLDLIKGGFSGGTESSLSTSSLLIGFLAAFITGTIACKWMINIVKKGKLVYFAYYCIVVGIATIIFSQLG